MCGRIRPRQIVPHHIKRVGPGWGDWVWALVDQAGRAWGTYPSEQAARAEEWSRHDDVHIERRGNVAPICAGLDSCHDRCHTEPGFEVEHDVAGIARRFGEEHPDL